VLRGLHFQEPNGQGKLVSALEGEVLDVAVDVRRGSPSFGKWVAVSLSADRGQQLYIPPGFAHGFAVRSEYATIAYKCTAYYDPANERTVRWDDPALGIDWRVSAPVLSARDAAARPLAAFGDDELPRYQA
jgi:dTDP-4-dehydrorhamnose 3,5-epimerase